MSIFPGNEYMNKNFSSLSNRQLYLAGVVFTGGLLGFGLFLQYIQHQDPCPLCMVQRLIFVTIMALYALAAVHNPKRTGQRVYGILIVLQSMLGIGVAARHIWIQNLPKDLVPACGPGLNYMLDTFPMSEVLKELMHGSGECATKGWTFLTLGIPEWSLLCYLALGVLAMLITIRDKRD